MATNLKLPDTETFTRDELAIRWECDISPVDRYVQEGQLKEALPPATREGLHDWIFYRCSEIEPLSDAFRQGKLIDEDDGREWLLKFIEHGEPLEKYIGRERQEKIIHCPKHLYMPIQGNAIINRDDQDYSMVRYFCDLHGDALIPLDEAEDGYRICFAPIKKAYLDSLIVPIEEVRRFEKKHRTRKEEVENVPPVTDRQEKIAEKKREDAVTPSPHPTDSVPDEQPPLDDYLINIKQVGRRVNRSKTFIYGKMKEGKFPQSIKDGRRTDWLNSEITAYIEGKWKPTDEAEESNE